MEYDRGDSFPFDFESNGIPCGLELKGKLSPQSYSVQFERKWKSIFLSVEEKLNANYDKVYIYIYNIYIYIFQ